MSIASPQRQLEATGLATVSPTRPFSKVLIANRGEIALRIVRACADLGLESVALVTAADRGARFTRLATDVVELPGERPAETYLNIGAILEAARTSGADAVHPGYGYLAESPEFAQAVIDAGLVWIGPSPAAIAVLGDKATARGLARQAGAPIPSGTENAVSGPEEVLAIGAEVGFPVAIKALYGGGGRGMRIAKGPEDVADALAAAQREAEAAFGRGECLVEKYIERPRHVETQCLADAHGQVHVLSTRDCSLQRRHQKVVEEAPAPGLSPEQLEVLTQASIGVLSAADYVGAATCEFLLGADGRPSFMEVNARVQVEHPVTEIVTGADIVAWQLRIAAGLPLPANVPDVRGHAIEFRLNAEDPATFLPAFGTVETYVPADGPGVRVDSGIEKGFVVGGTFDPMLAKLIVHGRDRDEAIRRAKRALAEFEIGGVTTLLPLHAALLREPDFVEDFSVHTRWLEEDFVNPFTPADRTAPAAQEDGVRLVVTVDGKDIQVTLPADLPGFSSGRSRRPRRKMRTHASAAPVSDGALTAPMQGTIVAVNVAEGDQVEVGDPLVVLEAMKMEQPLLATVAGTVTDVHVAVGATVNGGAPLIVVAS